jgi:uncharacterized protein YbjT (DUF2867 family)
VGAAAGAGDAAVAGLRAVVTGGTGSIGKHLVGELLASPRWERVTVVGRRRVDVPRQYGVDVAAEEARGRLAFSLVDMRRV